VKPVRPVTPDELLAQYSFLVDTNVISQLIRANRLPDPGIATFFRTVSEHRLFLSVVSIGEIEKGIDLIPWPTHDPQINERRRLQAKWEQRLESLCDRFAGRVIDCDVRIARQWGRFHAEKQRLGKSTPIVDTMIAASAQCRSLVLATLDRDFDVFGDVLTIYNPQTHTISGVHPPTE
jgi:predicted nucleic acid-binding protein